jgi:predicted nucleic acid-binding protein
MSGVERFFVDTNVLLYAMDPADKRKHDAARVWLSSLWETARGAVSWQVLHEFYVNALRKLGAPAAKSRAVVETFAAWQPAENNLGTIRRAWHWMDLAQLSYWDSLIVAAAEQSGCSWLLTEDLQEGRKLNSVTVVSPFHSTPEDFGLPPQRQQRT